jgi:CheY-like chemotaxis protein
VHVADAFDRFRVLLIEDEPANRALVRAIVSRSDAPAVDGLELLEAATLSAARVVLAAGRIDLVLSDVRLPDGSGLDLVTELRADPAPDAPTVVIVSASVLPSEQQQALRSGADAFLAKPFSPSDLIAVLERVRERRRGVTDLPS